MQTWKLLFVSAAMSMANATGFSASIDKSCMFKGKKLAGKVQIVKSLPDFKVQVVTSFPDLKVQKVSSLASNCGQWQFVNSLPDFKIQIVDSLPDFRIQYVTSFPGVR